MAGMLHVSCTEAGALGDVYATKNITPSTDVWVQFEVKIVAGLPAPGDGYSGDFAEVCDGSSVRGCVGMIGDVGLEGFWTCFSPEVTGGALALDTWYLVQYRTANGSPVVEELWVDGVDGGITPAGTVVATYDNVTFGQRFLGDFQTGFEFYLQNLAVGTTRGGTDLWDGDLSAGLAAFDATSVTDGQVLEVVGVDPPPAGTGGNRFYDTPDWRFVLTDLSEAVLTLLNPFATNRSLTKTLGAALVIEGLIDADNPKVNIAHTDGYPFLSEGDRFLFAFRRDGPTDAPWTCRGATTVLDVNPVADGDWATVRFVGYDQRQLLYKRPCRDGAGVPPGEEGLVYTGATARDIVVEQITRTETYDGPTYIKLDGANLNQTSAIDSYTIQQGMTIGELMDDLEKGGTIEFILDPLWQVFDGATPLINELATYDQAGVLREGVTFAWDRPGRNAESIDIRRDGGERENAVRTHYGQGGDAVTTYEDAASQARFGTYWGELFLPGLIDPAAVELVAAKRLQLQSNGKRTIAVRVSPERAAAPLAAYDIGDRVLVATSNAALDAVGENQRIRSIPIAIDDYGVETVSGLVFDEDGWSASS